jgi:uncharacterized linocin/CFP29 family protein
MDPNAVGLDFITNGRAMGTVAQRLIANDMSVSPLRPWQEWKDGRFVGNFINVNGQAVPTTNAATLRKEEWVQYDTAVLEETRQRLTGIADLESRGLTYNIGNGLGKTVLEHETVNDIGNATMDMDGLARGQNDRPEYVLNYLPLPIVHADFSVNLRQLAASRNSGSALDTTIASMKARRVAEKLEDIYFLGASAYSFGGGTIRGLLDHPNRNQYTLTAHWNDSAATGATIVADVLGMKAAAVADGFYGPFVLYIPSNFEAALDEDYAANYPKTVRNRLLEIQGIQDIKVADRLTADNVVLVQMTSDVVRLVNGMAINTLQWDEQGGLVVNFKIMCIKVPQIRATQSGKCGIVHGTK